MDIEENTQYRHRRYPARKARVTSVRNARRSDQPEMKVVSFDIYDPGTNEMPWRNSSSLSDDQFLTLYEPDVPDGAVPSRTADLHERASVILADLISDVEARTAPELVALRARIERVLEYMSHVTTPNVHTLSHIRRMLTTDDKY